MKFAGQNIKFKFISEQYMKPLKDSKQRKMSLDAGIQMKTRLVTRADERKKMIFDRDPVTGDPWKREAESG